MNSSRTNGLPLQARRLALLALLVAAAPATWAQTAMKAVGVFSLLGDSVQVAVSTEAPKDTRIERTDRYAFEAKGIGFDNIALRALRDALQKAQPQAQVDLYKAPTALSPEEQRAIAEGAASAELPAWIVQTIDAKRLSHVILVTRNRGDMNIRTNDNVSLGRGSAMGIGYYIDTLYAVRNPVNGEVSTGALAPYVHVKLTLMDAQSGAVLQTYNMREGRLLGFGESKVSTDPWTYLTAEQKVATLRRYFEENMVRAARDLLNR